MKQFTIFLSLSTILLSSCTFSGEKTGSNIQSLNTQVNTNQVTHSGEYDSGQTIPPKTNDTNIGTGVQDNIF